MDRQQEGVDQSTAPSLQSAFQAFRSSRTARCKKAVDAVLSFPRSHPQRIQHLRQQFLARIRHNIGVPYARKNHLPEGCECEGCVEAGRQLAQDSICRDCCGLIRKVIREMAGDFGFQLGPGNQAYQFDTLPLRKDSHVHLEPGDLIFYSGLYHNPDSWRHAFDMTHVEVFIGGETGEASIGSRWRQKCVQEFPSYAFVSQRWSLIKHHYVSIDTWLQGVCVPEHPELWQAPLDEAAPKWNARKYSIFDDESGEEAGDD